MFHMPSHIDRYEIKTLIGAGGMGSLYLARDTNPNTNRLVAIKLLLANLDSGDLRERFAREARALAALNHPNIVGIYDSGEFQGSPFIVMEYVRGETLGEKIKRRASLTLGQKIKLMVDLCSGLGHAHEAGIIHRDIKPANLMVDQHGRLKILDFGIARVSESLTRVGVQVTQLNMRIGTPGYMSPEQIEGGNIDPRSDVFAVGAVCYELLSYREAFTGPNTRQIENKVLQAQPERLTSLIPELDPEIELIVNRALAKDVDERYPDALALEQAFERVRWRLGPAETPIALVSRHTPDPSPAPSRKSRDSRADAAYHRSVSLYHEGAHEAARRFAIEALAEDPEHEEARLFAVERFGTKVWPPLPAATVHPYTASGPTVLRTETHPGATISADAPTVLSAGGSPSSARSRPEIPPRAGDYRKALAIAGVVAAVAIIAAGALVAGRWMTRPGPMLTIDKPEGGTLMADGINCGSESSSCTTELAAGAVVELRAEADKGYVFGAFTGDCAPHGRAVMSAARTCGGTFNRVVEAPAAVGVLLAIARPQGGTLIGDGIQCGTMGSECEVKHEAGRVVKLQPLADQDFTFKGFTGDCHPRTGQIVMNSPRRCSAMFVRDTRGNVAASNTGGGRSATPSSGGGSSSGAGPRARGGASTPDTTNPLGGATLGNTPLTSPGEPVEPNAPPKAPPSPESIAKDEIEKLLEAYRKAYEGLDVERIKGLYPGAPAPNLSYTFKQYKSLEYAYTTPPEFLDLNPALGTATVKVGALVTPEYRGPGQPPQKLINLFTLKRFKGIWAIENLQYPRK